MFKIVLNLDHSIFDFVSANLIKSGGIRISNSFACCRPLVQMNIITVNIKNLYWGRLSKNRLDFLSDLGSEP